MNRLRQSIYGLLFALALLATGYAALLVRLSHEGERAMVESDSLFDQGKLRESVVYARRAASLYAPGLPHVRNADARLDAIAVGAEAGRLHLVALLAWQAIRSTELLRLVGVGRNPARLELANRRLTGLLVTIGNDGALAVEDRASAQILAQLEARTNDMNLPLWGQLFGLGGVLVGLIGMATGIKRTGLLSVPVYLGGLVVVFGAIGWAVCLLLA